MKFPAALALLAVSAALAVHAAVDPDLKPVRVSGLGLGALPDALKPSLRVRLFLSNDERDTFPDMPPEEKFRVFATNEPGALPLGGGGADLLDLTGETCPWLGNDPATLWVEGRVHGASASLVTEVSLDGAVIGRDSVRIRVAPFLVLSNCVWSMERNGFSELLSPDTEVFFRPYVANMGGNVEATPPTARHPHGRIVVGNNLPDEAKDFLRAQEVQAENGELVELPLDWLLVGHVDEVMSVVPAPGGDGFKILVGDIDLALDLLRDEILCCETWIDANPDDSDALDYLALLKEKLSIYEDDANAQMANLVASRLACIRERLADGVGVQPSDLIRVPCLYPLPDVQSTGWNDPDKSWPNPVNMTVLVLPNGAVRILVPNPRFEPFAEKCNEIFDDLGYADGTVFMIETSGPHGKAGEVHCATSVLRTRQP